MFGHTSFLNTHNTNALNINEIFFSMLLNAGKHTSFEIGFTKSSSKKEFLFEI